MSSSVLERTRTVQEDIERYKQAIVEALDEMPKTQKEKILNQQRIAFYVNAIQKKSNDAIDLYTDKDGLRQAEIKKMSDNMLNSFNERLDEIQKYHISHPDLIDEPTKLEELDENIPFTGDEFWGKYIDIHDCYSLYINLPSIKRVDYIEYLSFFYKFDIIQMKTRLNINYSIYINDLYNYFVSFIKRTQPLFAIDKLLEEYKQNFEEKWTHNEIEGWEILKVPSEVDLSSFSSQEDFEKLGLDGCKELLTKLQLKCGGSLKDRANRLYMSKNTARCDLPIDMFALETKGKKLTLDKKPIKTFSDIKSVALQEYCIQSFAKDWNSLLISTQIYTEKKAVQTYEERLKEEKEQEVSEEIIAADQMNTEETTEEEQTIANPKNLPLGYDGKPIPFWLYKLQGLGEKFVCEICGNEVYLGRRAYEMHFQQAKHAHGMKCLGIPNTKHFQDITLIKDAQALYDKLKKTSLNEDWKQDDEEFEDSNGNVIKKSLYNDILRQGLL